MYNAIMLLRSYSPLNKKKKKKPSVGIYIALSRALQSENNHARHERVVPNRSAQNWPLQRTLRNEGFRRVQLMDTSAP